MSRKTGWAFRFVLALGLFALTAGSAAIAQQGQQGQQDSGSYGYLRVVEGSATLMQAGSGTRTPADVNQPVLVGDRIWVADRSRVELVLADRNLVRLDSGSELLLEHLAASPDANDRATVLRLLEGNMQVVVTSDSLGDELPRLETSSATIFPQDFGVYRVTTDQGGWTEVTVRRGKAQVDTGDGSEIVGADERAVVEGDRSAGLEVDDAGGYDNLERWATSLDRDGQADVRYVDDDLRYSAAPLNRYGSWVTVEDQSYWRPRVDAGWRPYEQGRWVYTPSGMTWVSYEPWGWVPYHYGSWDFLSGYGWLWRPGYVYSPAWVYWYWGTSYAGWCPIGYYSHYYGARYAGFHSGVYGWAGGDWGLFADWTFVPTSYFRGYRDGYRHGYWDGRHGGWRDQWDVKRWAVPKGQHGPLGRGIITTDSRPLKPETWGDPQKGMRVLTDQPTARRIDGKKGGGELPDVTPFIARKPELPPTVSRAVIADGKGNQIDGTPLRPGTLGRDKPGARTFPEDKPGDRDGRAGTPRVIAGDRPKSPEGTARTPWTGRQEPEAKGGAPRPDRSDRSGRGDAPRVIPAEPKESDTPNVRTPRSVRPDTGEKGGAPRPDRGSTDRRGDKDRGTRVIIPEDKPPSSATRPYLRTPTSTWSKPDDRGGAPRPEPSYRSVPQPKDDADRPSYRRPDPPPSRTWDRPADKERSYRPERPADAPRAIAPRPPERYSPPPERYSPPPRVEPQGRAPERSARPSNDKGQEGRSSGGRERSQPSDKGGGNRGNRGHHGGDDGDKGDGGGEAG